MKKQFLFYLKNKVTKVTSGLYFRLFYILLSFYFIYFIYKFILYSLMDNIFIIEHIFFIENNMSISNASIVENIDWSFFLSEEFQHQWCTMSQSDIHNFCRGLIDSTEFSLEFKQEVFEALIWLLETNINKGHNECLINLLLVHEIYEAWQFINEIK